MFPSAHLWHYLYRINLFAVLPFQLYQSPLSLPAFQFSTQVCERGSWQQLSLSSWSGDNSNRRSRATKQGPRLPGQARSTEGLSAAGHWGERVWHLISYHSEFCSCHWHLTTEKQSKDDGCWWSFRAFMSLWLCRFIKLLLCWYWITFQCRLSTSETLTEKVSS